MGTTDMRRDSDDISSGRKTWFSAGEFGPKARLQSHFQMWTWKNWLVKKSMTCFYSEGCISTSLFCHIFCSVSSLNLTDFYCLWQKNWRKFAPGSLQMTSRHSGEIQEWFHDQHTDVSTVYDNLWKRINEQTAVNIGWNFTYLLTSADTDIMQIILCVLQMSQIWG